LRLRRVTDEYGNKQRGEPRKGDTTNQVVLHV
jgi:hypothetical protein